MVLKKKPNILPYSWLGIDTNHKKYVKLKLKFEQICKWCGLTLEQLYKIGKKCTTNVLEPCLQMAIVSSSLKITKKTNSDNQIKQSHWLGKKCSGPHTHTHTQPYSAEHWLQYI